VNEKRGFCEECRADRLYTIEAKESKTVLKGETYHFTEQKAVCENCGNEIYVAELADENLKSVYDAYRTEKDLISLEQIREIPEKYNIGKRPLSLALGWGEGTFSRYFDGDLPTKQYSDILKKIYNDPVHYDNLLEANQSNLSSELAYKKSKAEVQTLLQSRQSLGKLDSIVDYIIYKCGDITPLALQKALYYSQGFHYAFTDEFMFEADAEAWVHGPVYSDVYSEYASYTFNPIASKKEFNDTVLTDVEKATLDSVIRGFCCYSGKVLEAFTHTERPWIETRVNLPVGAHSNKIISKKLIGNYFKTVKAKYEMLSIGDIICYATDLFNKLY